MNEKDKFWFWTLTAISNADINFAYYYNKQNDELFALNFKGKEYLPIFKNESSSNKALDDAFLRNIGYLKRNLDIIIKLPSLSLNDKKGFLQQFLLEITEGLEKEKLKLQVNSYKDNDVFNLNIENKQLYVKFDIEKGAFLARKVVEYYMPLGISENSKLVW